ncbi:MAG: RNA pseudouridine synthase [Micavibrio sp.]|nr:RNA pseudouridine synthase [Micavibrio sp.]|tara:strand:- start:821 stop:1804 length:984 start_codon:yes stop_codon:yes gene_type:complete
MSEEQHSARYVMGDEQNGLRFDKALGSLAEGLTRSRVQNLIKQGSVKLNGLLCTDTSRKVLKGEVAEYIIPEPTEAEPVAENIPLDIVYEDDDLLVINKAVGMVVHPGAGNWSGTLVNALLYHCGDSLSGIGGVIRPGIVHRLDKETSGLMVAAKNDDAHQGLSAQLEDRSLSRIYHALCLKVPTPVKGVVDMPIGRDARNRLKMAVRGQSSRDARTHYMVRSNHRDALSTIECKLETGRTHQIRVHMAAIKHALIGDPLYGPQPTAVKAAMGKAGYDEAVIKACLEFPRQALHATEIAFIHPRTNEELSFTSEMPDDLSKLLKLLY